MKEQFINKAAELARKLNKEDVKVMNISISSDNIRIRCKKRNNIFIKIYDFIKRYIYLKKVKKIVLDTSALDTTDGIKYVKEAKIVVILPNIIQELDKYKKQKSLFGINIKKVIDEILKDEEKKYILPKYKGPYEYSDDNTIKYCRRYKRNVILLTADKDLAVKAKSNKVEYILLEKRCAKKRPNKKVKNSNSTVDNKSILENSKQSVNEKKIKEIQEKEILLDQVSIPYNIKKQVEFINGRLVVCHNNPNLVIINASKETFPSNKSIFLNKGDIIYKIERNSNKRSKNKKVTVYKFVLEDDFTLVLKEKIVIFYINEIYMYFTNENLIQKLRKIFTSGY